MKEGTEKREWKGKKRNRGEIDDEKVKNTFPSFLSQMDMTIFSLSRGGHGIISSETYESLESFEKRSKTSRP